MVELWGVDVVDIFVVDLVDVSVLELVQLSAETTTITVPGAILVVVVIVTVALIRSSRLGEQRLGEFMSCNKNSGGTNPEQQKLKSV